jgi:hypothetical protein
MKYPPGCRFKHPALTQKPLVFLSRISECVVILQHSRFLLDHPSSPNDIHLSAANPTSLSMQIFKDDVARLSGR